jgi:hypothetical protein
MAKARAMPTRCFMPPESSLGFLSMAALSPTSATYLCTCSSTCARLHRGHLLRTAKAMLLRTLSQGISAWPWKTTPRSRLGPAISRWSMKT